MSAPGPRRRPAKGPPPATSSSTEWTEKQFQTIVTARAKKLGWRVMHVYRGRAPETGAWRTNTSSPGYPDLTLVRPPRIMFLELKKENGETSAAQMEWLRDLQACREPTGGLVETYVIRPSQVQALFDRLI